LEDDKRRLDKAIKIIRRIGLKSGDVRRFEDCEAVADIMTSEAMALIEDQGLRDSIGWLKKAHNGVPSIDRSRRNFSELAVKLFSEVGGGEKVKLYHKLESLCNGLSVGVLESVTDEELKEIIKAVRHVHDDYIERKVNLIRRIG